MNAFVPKGADDLKIVDAIDKFCEQKVQLYIDSCYQELADKMSAYQQKMKMKRETIANKGIWRGKKMYILNAWNVEGVQYSEPKLKLQGIEAVRSSTPYVCRENIKKGLSIIMNGTHSELLDFIIDFKNDFMKLPFEDIAFPRGVKGLDKYYDKDTFYIKGTPIHVKAALVYNRYIKVKKLNNLPAISDGDKIKFAYMKTPNPMSESVVAVPSELPEEMMGLDKYVDREMQFKKAFLEPLSSITKIIGWDIEDRSTLDSFFS
jgi:DNA polymerase elongation subunit (family B)